MTPRRAQGGAARRRLPRPLRLAAVVALAAAALLTAAGGSSTSGQEPAGPEPDPAEARRIELGRRLFADGCSSCHGFDLRGIPGRGPSLRGAGEAAADFYLRTGRMPLDDPEDQPVRTEPAYDAAERAAIVAYVGRFGGPAIPEVDPALGDIGEGLRLFTENCAGCHQVVAQGGITKDAVAPPLQKSEPVDVAEAIELGPYVMPEFGDQLSQSDVNSLAAYIESTRDPEDEGGWGIGNIGPIPEGMVAWLLAGAALLLAVRLIGERTTE